MTHLYRRGLIRIHVPKILKRPSGLFLLLSVVSVWIALYDPALCKLVIYYLPVLSTKFAIEKFRRQCQQVIVTKLTILRTSLASSSL